MHDLTNLENPRFEYRVVGKTPTDPPVEVSLDMDRVQMDLYLDMPMLFKPLGVDGEGNPRMGLNMYMEYLRNGGPLHESLPSLAHFELAARRAFKVPDWCGITTILEIMLAWVKDVNARSESKKDVPVSPDSSTPTPA